MVEANKGKKHISPGVAVYSNIALAQLCRGIVDKVPTSEKNTLVIYSPTVVLMTFLLAVRNSCALYLLHCFGHAM